MSEYECKNCGDTILPEDIEWLEDEIKRLTKELESKKEHLEAKKAGFCDSLCEDCFNGDA